MHEQVTQLVGEQAALRRVATAVAGGAQPEEVFELDDGRGGADPSRGSGLRGLADRVEVLDGSISLDSPEGVGTRLRAEFEVS